MKYLSKIRSKSKRCVSRRRRSKSKRCVSRRRKNLDGIGNTSINNVVMFKAPFNCSACNNAEELLQKLKKEKNITEYEVYDIESDKYKNEYEKMLNTFLDKASQEELNKFGKCYENKNYKCFPRIFIDGKFIGGYKDLSKFVIEKNF